MLETAEKIPKKDELRKAETNRRQGNELIDRLKSAQMLIGGWISNSPHHAGKTDIMHRKEAQIKKDESQNEVNLPKSLVEHSPEHLWVPSVDRCKDGEDACLI